MKGLTRTDWVALIGAQVIIAVWWMPVFAKYGVLGGLFWLAVTFGFLFVVVWAAGSSRKDPGP